MALSRLFGGRPTAVRTGPARGLLLRPEPRSVAWLTGKVEPEVQDTVVGLLRPGDTFVDVGASVGFFTLLAARVVGPGGTVLAFEPSTAQADSLRTNVALNDLTNVDVAETALSDRAGLAFLDAPGTATAKLVAAAGPGAAAVETTTLDAYLRERPHVAPAVVKVDVEGHEEAVLAGMRETLRTVRPALIVELHDSRGFVDLLTDAGYTVGNARWRPPVRERTGHARTRRPRVPIERARGQWSRDHGRPRRGLAPSGHCRGTRGGPRRRSRVYGSSAATGTPVRSCIRTTGTWRSSPTTSTGPAASASTSTSGIRRSRRTTPSRGATTSTGRCRCLPRSSSPQRSAATTTTASPSSAGGSPPCSTR